MLTHTPTLTICIHDDSGSQLRSITRMVLLAIAALISAGDSHAAEDTAAAQAEESWEVVYIQGQRVGYAHSRTWQSDEDGHTRIWSEVVTSMTVKRFGATLHMTVTLLTEEDEQGNLLTFSFETDNPPASNTTTTGRVDGDTLKLTTKAAGQTRDSSQPWDTAIKSPAYQDRLLSEDPVEPGESRTIKIFDPQFLKVAELTFRGEDPATTELLDGTSKLLDRLTMTHSLMPIMKTTIYSDAEGESVKTETNLLQMVTYAVSRDEALKEIAGVELDLAISTLVKVEPIERAHRSSRIVYELTLDRPQLPVEIPTGPTQAIKRINETTHHVTVTAIRPDGNDAQSDTTETVEQAVDDIYLVASRQLECKHPAVVELAKAAAAERTDPADIALAMERHVHRALTSKNFSTALATAAEVAQTREGDCTEHAVLLAAMLRVKGIPSRIAIGLVYAESHRAFGGHMWTEAYLNGRWVPLDATLGQGGIGAAHIKFADSSLADEAPAAIASFVPLMGLLEHMSLRVIEKK